MFLWFHGWFRISRGPWFNCNRTLEEDFNFVINCLFPSDWHLPSTFNGVCFLCHLSSPWEFSFCKFFSIKRKMAWNQERSKFLKREYSDNGAFIKFGNHFGWIGHLKISEGRWHIIQCAISSVFEYHYWKGLHANSELL